MNLIGVGGIDPRNGRSYTYIETIAGGQGGRPSGDGMDGVQCNMTNTMNTPVEALEISYPLRVERYELREGSGGAGQHRGGHGVVRSLTVVDHDARVSLQSDRRRFAPYGLDGGGDGTPGRNWVRDRDGNDARAARQGFPHAACRARRSASRRQAAAAGARKDAGPNRRAVEHVPTAQTSRIQSFSTPLLRRFVLTGCWRTVGLQGGNSCDSKIAAAVFVCLAAIGSGVHAQQLDKKQFNVVGTWNFLTNWQKLEQPLWATDMPAASGGNITGNIKSITELNLKGTELLRLLKQGVFDVAAALPIYVEDGAAVIEASDIAGVAKDFKMGRDIVTAWMPEMQTVMKEKHGAMILATFPFPEQVFFCRGEIKTIDDLKGKKIRVQGTSQGDFAAAVGAAGGHDRLRRGGAGAREGRRRLRHHRHDAGLQGQVDRGDQHAVPPARRLHHRHLGGEPERLEQAVQGYAGLHREADEGARGQVLEGDRGRDRGRRRLQYRHRATARSARPASSSWSGRPRAISRPAANAMSATTWPKQPFRVVRQGRVDLPLRDRTHATPRIHRAIARAARPRVARAIPARPARRRSSSTPVAPAPRPRPDRTAPVHVLDTVPRLSGLERPSRRTTPCGRSPTYSWAASGRWRGPRRADFEDRSFAIR